MSDPLWPAMAPPAWRAIAAAPRDETRHETDDGYTYEFDVNHPPSAAIAAAPQLRRDKCEWIRPGACGLANVTRESCEAQELTSG